MVTRRRLLAQAAGAATLAAHGSFTLIGAQSPSASPVGNGATSHITGATAVTEVFGDGQKLTAVAVAYDAAIDSATLSVNSFQVADRTVTQVYTVSQLSPAQLESTVTGPYVIVELSADDAGASLTGSQTNMGGNTGSDQGTPGAGNPGGGPGNSGSGDGAGQTGQAATLAEASVIQVGTISTADGVTYSPVDTAVATTDVLDLIVDAFQQFEYQDPTTGQTLPYNLYIPQNADNGDAYPLVLFMHDAGVLSTDVLTTLTQGLGAVSWASPADQAARPAFVLAPQYPEVTVDDNSGYVITDWVQTTVDLLDELTTQYPIDTTRLYTTGQSMGAMMSIIMGVQYPDLFAASFIVAGQWDPTLVAPLADDKMWVLVSEGDTKAFPGQNAIMAVLADEGAVISTAVWDGSVTAEELDEAATTMAAEGSPINFSVFEGGDHSYTWQIAYTIDGIRSWIFEQHR